MTIQTWPRCSPITSVSYVYLLQDFKAIALPRGGIDMLLH